MLQFDLETSAHAFGDGSHPTTSGCLTLMAALAPCSRVLDMGCGSGILSLTAAHLCQATVLAVDRDPAAVQLTARNAAANGLEDRITSVRSDGYAHPLIAARTPYDLIVCNVLAAPVIAWAPSLAAHLAPQGLAIVSGMLAWQREAVEEAHHANGLATLTAVQVEAWITVLFHKQEMYSS